MRNFQAERDTTAEREAEETRRRNVLRIEVEGAKAAAKRAHDDLQREKADRAALADSSEAAFKSEVSVPLGSMREESPKTVPGEQKAQPEVKIPGEKATSEVKMASEVTAEDAEDDGSGWRQRMAARTLQSGNSFTLARYRSVRDHNGRYYLVVKVR